MWVKKTKTGNDYYSVKVELEEGKSVWVNLFYNKFKKGPTHPDFVTINDSQQDKKEQDGGIPF